MRKKNLFTNQLLEWFNLNKRDLDFRKDKDPYKVWVSEIMAQQTQIATLLPYFKRFIERYPNVTSLANSSLEDVYSVWEGLGYYSRAKNLKKAAEIINELPFFPKTYDDLKKLPGVGPYTAGAIASICFNEKVPAIDGNVIRVISRYYGFYGDMTLSKNKRLISDKVLEIMPERAGDFNEALMELGALICSYQNPKCLLCPVYKECFAYKNNQIKNLPEKKQKEKPKKENYDALIILKDDKPLFIKREEKLLNGLFGFPIIKRSEKSICQFVQNYNLLDDPKNIGKVSHRFTHLIWDVDVYVSNLKKDEIPEGFTNNPSSIPTVFKKMVNLMSEAF